MRGRKPLTDRPKEWKLRIPTSVADAISLLIADPLTGKPPLGARSELTTKLYREHLKKVGAITKEAAPPDEK
jgi:hypothetical protein